jgi:hypothetical protein
MDINNLNYPDAQNWLADLRPQVLRFPGGSNSRWMHLLPYDTDGDHIDDVFPKGYGYDIEELIRYYDATDLNFQVDDPDLLEDIMDDMMDGDEDCSTCNIWVDAASIENFETFSNDYYTQETHTYATESVQYIDQFIELVDFIQTREDYAIDVIVDLNVISESATQSKRIVDYLRSHDVHVVGVEFGNECNLKWATDIMGFHEFEDYYFLMNGKGVDDLPDIHVSTDYQDWLENFYAHVFSEQYQNDHNYFEVFKNESGFTCKVGIPAANLQGGEPPYAFKEAETLTLNWNDSLVVHYNDYFLVDEEPVYYFDAVVLHPYFEADANWGPIALSYFCHAEYPNSGEP